MRAERMGDQWTNYLMVGGATVGARFDNTATGTGVGAIRYVHPDHLGSVSVLTDERGTVVERDSYDAWGKRRSPDGADDPAGALTSQTTRGFTGQEHLAGVGLIHLNARAYDPLVGRFTSADSLVPFPLDPQSFNRYAYVRNRPLFAADPSGHQEALPTIHIGAPPGYSYAFAIPTGSQFYFSSLYNIPNLGSLTAINGLAIGSQIQYLQYKRQLEIANFQRLLQIFQQAQRGAAATAQPSSASSVAAGFAINSAAYGYASGYANSVAGAFGYLRQSFDSLAGGVSGFASRLIDDPVDALQQMAGAGPGLVPGLVPAAGQLPAAVGRGLALVRAAESAGPRTFTSSDPLVADLANEIEAAYPGHVVGVNVPVRNAAGQLVTDADIELQNAIIQVKSGGGKGLTSQLLRTEQATGMPTIGYGPTLKPSVVRSINQAGGLVTTDQGLLIELVKP